MWGFLPASIPVRCIGCGLWVADTGPKFSGEPVTLTHNVTEAASGQNLNLQPELRIYMSCTVKNTSSVH
jgi:hypothetical protein